MPSIPQIILTLSPTGELIAEAPGRNGQRKRIDLCPGQELMAMRAELLGQRDLFHQEQMAKDARLLHDQKSLHRRVWQLAAERHSIDFAEKMLGKRDARSAPKKKELKSVTKLSLTQLGL